MKIFSEILAVLLAFVAVACMIATVALVYFGIFRHDHSGYLVMALITTFIAIIDTLLIFLLLGKDRERFRRALVSGAVGLLPPW